MAERLVVNTGPLIALARIEVLDVIGRLPFEIICPQEVRDELDEGAELICGLVDGKRSISVIATAFAERFGLAPQVADYRTRELLDRLTPDQLGDYYIAVPAGREAALAEEVRRSPIVQGVSLAPGLPPDN